MYKIKLIFKNSSPSDRTNCKTTRPAALPAHLKTPTDHGKAEQVKTSGARIKGATHFVAPITKNTHQLYHPYLFVILLKMLARAQFVDVFFSFPRISTPSWAAAL